MSFKAPKAAVRPSHSTIDVAIRRDLGCYSVSVFLEIFHFANEGWRWNPQCATDFFKVSTALAASSSCCAPFSAKKKKSAYRTNCTGKGRHTLQCILQLPLHLARDSSSDAVVDFESPHEDAFLHPTKSVPAPWNSLTCTMDKYLTRSSRWPCRSQHISSSETNPNARSDTPTRKQPQRVK